MQILEIEACNEGKIFVNTMLVIYNLRNFKNKLNNQKKSQVLQELSYE